MLLRAEETDLSNTSNGIGSRQSAGFSNPVEVRMISAIRLALASFALLVVYIDPFQPDRQVRLTYTLLVSYTVYCALLCVLTFLAPRFVPLAILHWLDLIWYTGLIAVSSGTNSIFFFFFIFAILVASFRWGSSAGLQTALASTLLFAIVGYASAPPEPHFELNRFLLRSFALLVLGFLIAHWGGSEVSSKRRLRFLHDITRLSNPRFGIERTLNSSLERLRSLYDADACVLIQPLKRGNAYRITRADRSGPDAPKFAREITDELTALLLSPEPGVGLAYTKRFLKSYLYDIGSSKSSRQVRSYATVIAKALDATAYLSVPILYRGQPNGRLYVVGSPQRMNRSDIEFVLQVIEHVTPVLDNIWLVDRLASDAADQERHKLARDIHDSVIQPYVGLQLGLIAVKEKLSKTNGAGLAEISELCEMANEEMRELRRYLERLKSDSSPDSVLVPAVRRFASKYSAATGINVSVNGIDDLRLNDRLAGEAFQMVAEGLSNVRRHTNARNAEVEIACSETDLVLRIINDSTNGAAQASFQPGSITQRATALGGEAHVYFNNDRTVVDVRIPL